MLTTLSPFHCAGWGCQQRLRAHAGTRPQSVSREDRRERGQERNDQVSWGWGFLSPNPPWEIMNVMGNGIFRRAWVMCPAEHQYHGRVSKHQIIKTGLEDSKGPAL